MTIRCPVCRADNDDAMICRRCKADLTPLVELENRRILVLQGAAHSAAMGDGDAVLRHAHEAQLLRAGPDAKRWLAIGHLLRREFVQALECQRSATA